MEEPKKEETKQSENDVGSLEKKDTVATDTSAAPVKKEGKKLSFSSVVTRINIYLVLFIFIIVVAIFIAFIAVWKTNKEAAKSIATTTISGESLSPAELAKLQSSNIKIGDVKQSLNVEANAIFSGNVLVKGGLDIAGTVKVGSALSLPGITVSGVSSFGEVSVNTLSVAGNESIQGTLTVQKSVVINGDVTVGGTFTAKSLTIENMLVSGNLSVNKHIDAGGPSPIITRGSGLNGAGTVSISGTDTAGTVTINVNSSSNDKLATVTFTSSFAQTPHVVITPVGPDAAAINYYVTRNANGFSIASQSATPSGVTLIFDYIVID